MVKQEKIHLEYFLKATSKNVIWDAISTPSGLERWFADKVRTEQKNYFFQWGKEETRKAEMLSWRNASFIRFHWTDDEDTKSYFEMKLNFDELTNEIILEITDFALSDETDELKGLWNSLINKLKRSYGI